MSTAAVQHAQQEGVAFAARFYERHPFPWPDITVPLDGPKCEHRTAGRWETGQYTPEVQRHMAQALAEACDADLNESPRWTDPALQAAWKAAAVSEFARRLHMVAQLPEPTASAGQ